VARARRYHPAIDGEDDVADERMQDEILVAGEYFLAVEGYALIRNCLHTPSAGRPRLAEIREIITRFDEFPNSLTVPLFEHAVEPGYTRWAPRYDGPNPAVAREEPIFHSMLAPIAPGDALDAACGTGRHAAHLAALGHRVIGVDTTEAMLDVARTKVPDADFRPGRLEALPLDDASVDLITCALALTHVADLEPVMREFARVLRPGGQVVLSDIHPLSTVTGSIAGAPEQELTDGIPYVRNLTHHVSEYIAAFLAAGLGIVECREPPIDEATVASFPSFLVYPDATRQAFLGVPYLLLWRVERPDAT
jgi:ubiquinone/menaquinone biosynthesis C-methylase UbiE